MRCAGIQLQTEEFEMLRSTITTAAILTGLTVSAPAYAQTVVPGVQTAVATTDLNLRAGPGTRFPVVTTIPSNQSVTVHGCIEGRDWCDVTFGNNRGWAYGEYLATTVAGSRVIIADAGPQVTVPMATFAPGPYWETHYRDRPFFAERDRWIGVPATTGAVGGAAIGAAVGGPVGAVIGGIAGSAMGAAIAPPAHVHSYVVGQTVPAVRLDGQIAIGATLPPAVTLHAIPDYDYRFAVVNDRRVLVDPATRTIVHVIP
jgi:uncharacterized protein YraI